MPKRTAFLFPSGEKEGRFVSTASAARIALRKFASPQRAAVNIRFFKTGKGQYGYGDVFIGVTVPDTRQVAKAFCDLSLPEIKRLLSSKIHEERTLALLILVEQFRVGDEAAQARIYRFYLSAKKHINNWDLVDGSASYIVGPYLKNRSRAVLYKLSRSKNLWDKRIAILATFHFIRQGEFTDTLRLAKAYLVETHDLTHKATGWMLREVGKRDLPTLKKFLNTHHKEMPRTMLRYAIEKLPERERKAYLAGKIKK